MNYNKIAEMAQKAHKSAVPEGKLEVDGKVYLFKFNRYNYDVFFNGNVYLTFNTRSIKQAKIWLKEYLQN